MGMNSSGSGSSRLKIRSSQDDDNEQDDVCLRLCSVRMNSRTLFPDGRARSTLYNSLSCALARNSYILTTTTHNKNHPKRISLCFDYFALCVRIHSLARNQGNCFESQTDRQDDTLSLFTIVKSTACLPARPSVMMASSPFLSTKETTLSLSRNIIIIVILLLYTLHASRLFSAMQE